MRLLLAREGVLAEEGAGAGCLSVWEWEEALGGLDSESVEARFWPVDTEGCGPVEVVAEGDAPRLGLRIRCCHSPHRTADRERPVKQERGARTVG